MVRAGNACPRCGARGLFSRGIAFAPRCHACGLDFAQFNVGDGAAAFVTLAVGAIVVVGVVVLELSASPPFWVHALLWLPLTVALVLGGLRFAKAWLLHAEYRNAAREGRLRP